MLISMIYKSTPDELRLILIDPKAKPDEKNEQKIREFCSLLLK